MDILVVEDNPLEAVAIRRLLESWDFQPRIAASVEQAEEALAERLPRLVVADAVIGCDLCSVLKGDPGRAHIPVLLVTRLSAPDEIMRGMEAGADGYMLKPYEPALLQQRIRELASRPAEVREKSVPVEVELEGRRYSITASRRQIIPMLMSTFESALAQQRQLRKTHLELTRANQELIQRNQELGAAIERQNHFLGMAVHDLRSPLAVTIGYADFLLAVSHGLPDPCTRLLEEIRRSSTSVKRLVEDLLDLSALESGKLSLRKQPTCLGEVCTRVVELQRVIFSDRGIELCLKTSPDIPQIQADPRRMEQVISQLLGNALKRAPEGSLVQVFLAAQAECVRISVRDQGPPFDANSMFQPVLQDSGLEFAILKKVVEAHSGEVELQGSTLSIHLPVQASAAPA